MRFVAILTTNLMPTQLPPFLKNYIALYSISEEESIHDPEKYIRAAARKAMIYANFTT